MQAAQRETVVVWRPQPGPQTALLSCPIKEVFYGGARGGGKTDAMLGEWAQHSGKYGKHAIGCFFRRELAQLDEAIERSKEIYRPLGFDWQEQKKQWTSPTGARLKFRYLDRDSDAENYQGHSYTRIYFEELTNFPDPKPVMKLKATLRSGQGIPCRLRATGNPGGPGHQWVKARYIDPNPDGYMPILETVEIHGKKMTSERVFIPALLKDNKYLGDEYVLQLAEAGSEALVKAWLDGDWSVIDGAFFDCWSASRHVVRPVALPATWTRFRALDWGFAKPFSVGWYAISDGSLPQFPKGALIKYREWYGKKDPNVGIRLDAEELAKGILERERDDPRQPGVAREGPADPSVFAEDGGPSLAERMAIEGCAWYAADNKRVPGWDQVRARLKGEDDMGNGDRPMLYFFSTCVDSIRTIPALQHDDKKPEDLDTDGEDHAADELRYACMSRPYVRVVKAPEKRGEIIVGGQSTLTWNSLVKEHDRQKRQRAGRV